VDFVLEHIKLQVQETLGDKSDVDPFGFIEPEVIAQRLVEEALNKGSQDNVSVILVVWSDQ
jgi:serine/threonine protein phosphatase PrpC